MTRPASDAAHGQRRTNGDKRKAVMTLLEDGKWSQWPQTKIADTCNVTQGFVSKLAAESGPESSYNKNKTRKVERFGSEFEMNTANIGRTCPGLRPALELPDSVLDPVLADPPASTGPDRHAATPRPGLRPTLADELLMTMHLPNCIPGPSETRCSTASALTQRTASAGPMPTSARRS